MAALRGVRVLELSGLAPAPFAGMILADFGASVIRVDRVSRSVYQVMDRLGRGKRSVAVDLKTEKGVELLRKMSKNSDVLIEPYRAGVMEKLGLGPEVLLKDNRRLIYARLTGFGRHGPFSQRAGHDINYVALSGTLSLLGRHGDKPVPPLNLLADFAGGGMMCVLGIILALFERAQSGQGQIVDASMLHGVAYLTSFVHKTRDIGVWMEERGKNLLDSGAPFYDTYETADGEYMAVGALEPQFYMQLLEGLGLENMFPNQMDREQWTEMRAKFTEVFLTKTRRQWCDVFDGSDACVTPVLSLTEAARSPQTVSNDVFLSSGDGFLESAPAPKLSRTPGKVASMKQPELGKDTREVLAQYGLSSSEIDRLEKDGVIHCGNPKSSL